MVSTDRLRLYLRYYGALIVLVFGTLWVLELLLGDELDFWANVVALFVLVFVYDRLLGTVGWSPGA